MNVDNLKWEARPNDTHKLSVDFELDNFNQALACMEFIAKFILECKHETQSSSSTPSTR